MLARLGSPSVDQWVLNRIHRALGRPPVRLRTGSGAEISSTQTPPLGQIVIADRATLGRLILNPELGFGEGYANGRIEVQGDLVSILEAMALVMPEAEEQNWWVRTTLLWLSWIQANTPSGSRRNIHQHYDLCN